MEKENICECPPSFGGLGIAPKLLDILSKEGFTSPTPIQHQAIPVAIEGNDVIGIAQTGTGKTLAFGIPTIQRLAQHKGRALIVLPTRELALQVDENLQRIGKSIGLKTTVLIGGASIEPQKKALASGVHIIIGTPGRIIDHIEQRTLKLNDTRILILDEADRMLDMGFLPQIRRILKTVPSERQTMLFSATMPDTIVKIATEQMRQPLRIEVARPGTTAENVEQELFVVAKDQKNRLLEKLLGEYRGSVLVFARTRFAAKRVARAVNAMGHTAADIHSDRSLSQRRDALEGFKNGRYRVLVATDIASRGIDVTGIEVVINYDIPQSPDDYVHRIGRTGRAGMAGRAITFAMPDEGEGIEAIEKEAQMCLPIRKLPELPPDRRPPPGTEQRSFGRREVRGGRRDRNFGGRGRGNERPAGNPPVGKPVAKPVAKAPEAKPAVRPGMNPANGGRHQNNQHDRRDRRPQDSGRRNAPPASRRREDPSTNPDFGIALWPDTPNIHGGLNRKPIK